MIGFPHAKINLGLSIISKRADGFHDLESVFYPLPFRDILEIIPAAGTGLNLSGIFLTGNASDNLVWRALDLVKNYFPGIKPLEIHLYKAIPSGAGLGGGSSDAACMLKLLNACFSLQLAAEELKRLASILGSDCPFFLQSSACFVRGRGEILEPVSLDLSGYSILLVHAGIPISTAWAYGQINPAPTQTDLRQLITEPVKNWRNHLFNAFEIPVFRQHPQLEKIKAQLYGAGALYASMTGSGSSFYGIFAKNGIPPLGIDPALKQTFLP